MRPTGYRYVETCLSCIHFYCRACFYGEANQNIPLWRFEQGKYKYEVPWGAWPREYPGEVASMWEWWKQRQVEEDGWCPKYEMCDAQRKLRDESPEDYRTLRLEALLRRWLGYRHFGLPDEAATELARDTYKELEAKP